MSAPYTITIDLPEGSMVAASIAVVSYVGTDGVPQYWVKASDGADMTTLLGLLTFAEHDVVEIRNRNERRPDE